MINILCVAGTRPEAIKMAPVILALQKESWTNVRILATAQHRYMLDQVLSIFGIKPDIDLNIMQPNQKLTTLTARLLLDLDQVIQVERPDVVLIQGDTTTVMSTALACFYHQIPIGHIEAGLRTGDFLNPFPEEMNRVVTGRLAHWHFAPTQSAKDNLLREGILDNTIEVTGNTVIDALMTIAQHNLNLNIPLDASKRLILVTAHRRENFGPPFHQICSAIRSLADRYLNIEILYPVHPNPNIISVAHALLSDHPRIRLCEPLDYLPFVAAMKRAYLILTDSGGVQEEAPALGKPVLVLRRETERPEAVNAGVVKLVGSDYDTILEESAKLLDNPQHYASMAQGISPYGDGHAAERIVTILRKSLVG